LIFVSAVGATTAVSAHLLSAASTTIAGGGATVHGRWLAATQAVR
jgi:hypothetical protein